MFICCTVQGILLRETQGFPPLFVKNIGRVSAYFENTQIGTRVHQARVPSWMKLKRGCTSSSFQFILPRLLPELGGLGYQYANFQNRQIPCQYSLQIAEKNLVSCAGVCPELCNRCTSLTFLVNIVAILKINGLHPRVFAVVVV